MAKRGERSSSAAENAGHNLKGILRVGPPGALSTLLILLALIAALMFGITLLFRH